VDRFELTFAFLDRTDCGIFYDGLSAQELEQDEFDVALPDPKFNLDNDTLSAIVTFVQHGGLQAVAGVAGLLKAAIDHIPRPKSSEKKVVIKSIAGEEVEIHGDMTAEEIRDLLNDKIFRRK
jgi:hypothetical protein